MTYSHSSVDKITKVKALVYNNGGWLKLYQNFNGLSRHFENYSFRHGPCPSTGIGNTRFRFYKDVDETGGAFHHEVGALPDGIEVLSWYNGWTTGETLNEIIKVLGGDFSCVSDRDVELTKIRQKNSSEFKITDRVAKERQARIDKYWNQSVPIVGTLAETYLRSRGIKGDLNAEGIARNLRFVKSMPYKEDDISPWQNFPTMIAIYRDKYGNPLTLHRTFLSPCGTKKADVGRPKMVLAPPRCMIGGYIEIDAPINTGEHCFIGTSEGIENALSVREATGCPMQVGTSDRLMEAMHVRDEVDYLLVFEDIEPSGAGSRAGAGLKKKYEGKKFVKRFSPSHMKRSKVDWNDVYVEMGIRGFFYYVKDPSNRVYTGVDLDAVKREIQ